MLFLEGMRDGGCNFESRFETNKQIKYSIDKDSSELKSYNGVNFYCNHQGFSDSAFAAIVFKMNIISRIFMYKLLRKFLKYLL